MAQKRKPTAMRKLSGISSKRTAVWEPRPNRDGGIYAPKTISDRAQRVWPHVTKMLAQMDVLTSADVLALEQLCEAYADKLEARTELRMKGMFYKSGNGMMRANPAMALIDDADRRIWKWLTEFGCTPSSRTKVRTIKPHKGVRGGSKDQAPTSQQGLNGSEGSSNSHFF